jgi:hypothetical protein
MPITSVLATAWRDMSVKVNWQGSSMWLRLQTTVNHEYSVGIAASSFVGKKLLVKGQAIP